MTTKNYDSSQHTRKQQAKVLGGYAAVIAAANNNENGVATVRTTQPTYQSAVIVTYQNIGKCYCFSNYDSSYNSRVTGACGCGTSAGAS